MKTGDEFIKEAEAASMETLGEVNKDFVIGYLSKSLELLKAQEAKQNPMNAIIETLSTIPGSGYENFTPAQVQASSKSGLATKSPGLSGPVLKERVRR